MNPGNFVKRVYQHIISLSKSVDLLHDDRLRCIRNRFGDRVERLYGCLPFGPSFYQIVQILAYNMSTKGRMWLAIWILAFLLVTSI